MSDRLPSGYVRGALISGWPAYAFARTLRRYWRDAVEDLPPHLREPLEDALVALEFAAREFAEERKAAAASGSAEAVPAEAAITSKCREELTTAEVASDLQVSERRVRQLAGLGRLPGRLVAGRWTFDPGAVAAYRETGGAR